MALGNRAHLAGLNIVGLRRRGFTRDQIHDIRRAYRLLFADEGTLKERVEDVAEEFATHPFVHEILDFIRDGGDRAHLHAAERPRGGGLMAADAGPIAILAGSGQLPVLLVDRLRRDGRDHRILAFRGFAAPETAPPRRRDRRSPRRPGARMASSRRGARAS